MEEWKEGNQLDILIVDYFQSVFTTKGQEGPTDFLESVRGKISPSINEELPREFTSDEILSPSTNEPHKGFGPGWHASSSFSKVLAHSEKLNHTSCSPCSKMGHFLAGFNHTIVTIIPKKERETNVVNYKALSYIKALSILLKGRRWWIRDGETTKVCIDPWIQVWLICLTDNWSFRGIKG